jgi:hypothetical protein
VNIRFDILQRKATSALAALVVSTFFIGAAVGPAVSAGSQVAMTQSLVRAA